MYQLNDAEAKALRLGKIASISSGHNFRFAIDSAANGNAYAIQMGNVERGAAVSWPSVSKTNIQTVRKAPDWLKDNDIIFLARGRENFALFLTDVPANTVCTSHFFVIRVHDSRYLSGFIAWQLNQPPLQEYFSRNRAGSAQQHITASVLKDVELTYSEIEIQQNIINLNTLLMREKQIFSGLLENRQQQLAQISQHILNRKDQDEYL